MVQLGMHKIRTTSHSSKIWKLNVSIYFGVQVDSGLRYIKSLSLEIENNTTSIEYSLKIWKLYVKIIIYCTPSYHYFFKKVSLQLL